MSKFSWRIENFSQSEDEYLRSLAFVVNENKWRLVVYPKGKDADQHLCLCLCVADSSSLPADWSIHTKYSLSVVNQIHPNKTIKIESKSGHTFKSGESGRGWRAFMELSKFHDKSEGYLVQDACLIEAEVDISPAFTDKESNSSIAIDPIECMYIEARSFLESLPKAPCSSASNAPLCEMPLFIKRDVAFAKQIIDKLVSYRMDDLADPKHETAMMHSLSTLTDHLYLFSNAQAKEIVNLKATLPQTMQEWRGSVQVKKDTSKHPWSTFEKTKSLLQESVKTEEGIKIELEELSKKETELEALLEVIQRKSQLLKEEREEITKQLKTVCSLAKDKASKTEVKMVEANCVNQQLEQRLKSKWVARRHLFALRKKK